MLYLPRSLAAWNTPDFSDVLRQEIESAGASALPLQQCLTATSYAVDAPCSAMLIGAADDPACLRVRVGIFFHGVIAGCSCADDPTPVESQQEYCELELAIDKASAATTVTPATD